MARIKRNPLFAAKNLVGVEISNQITALNAWIQPTAQLFAGLVLRSTQDRSHAQIPSRSVTVLGEGTSGLLQVHASQPSSGTRRNFLQTVLEIFMVHWAAMIIEAWYPKQQSFADILAELSIQKHNSRAAPRIRCGAPVKVLSMMPHSAEFQNWALEILKDLDGILLDANVAFPTSARNDIQRNLVTLSEKAYDLRTALAERDLCGNIQLALVSPDMMFQAKWMEDVQTSASADRECAVALTDAERVAGTCRLGLQMPGTTPGAAAHLILKPKVALLRKLRESL
ncbi:hypothetical protein D9619_004844 [Psilocybe cf. subviscida]|uniref:Uncharacterized protein n=1 Tax=Psilocybe cf. subviscida TaxID=2480587 RepID=A0A8H5BR86_9AGAR|nr:hypothetical protein D9619_004844 [Psilocybe cf. subviscida]